jgi:hypothetical protein
LAPILVATQRRLHDAATQTITGTTLDGGIRGVTGHDEQVDDGGEVQETR